MYGEGELKTVSEGWVKTVDISTTDNPNISWAMEDDEHFCKLVLYKEIQDSRVRIWDVVILVPNLLFLLFIIVRFNRARLKLRATSSPIFLAFYGLVICNIVISVIRCVVSMTVNAAASVGGKADKVLWVTVRFFLLSTEMSVVIFGLAFGHLDSRSSIRRVLLATSLIALVFTITQGTLELILPDDTFHIPSRDFYVFGHGGMMFWFCSSLVFTVIYIFILILPRTSLRDRLTLPTKKSFYIYAGTLASLNLVQSIGAGLLNYTQNPAGLCVVDLTAAVYLTLFTPLVYHTFLSEFFGISQPSIQFSYKAQVDDGMDEDTVSLPHQQSFSSLRTDSDYIYQVHTPSIHMPLYESLASKPSTSKQKISLFSLASRRDPNTTTTASTSRSSSQLTLYGTSPDARNLLSIRRKTQKSTPELGKNLMSERDKFIQDSQKSTPNLSYERPNWNYGVTKSEKYSTGPSESITNLIVSPNTASNFIYKPNDNDSSVNLFSDTGNIVATSTNTTSYVVREMSPSDQNISPPLESSLENILNNDTRDSIIEPQTAAPRTEFDSAKDNFIELSSTARLGRNIHRDNPPLSCADVETNIGNSSRSTSPRKSCVRENLTDKRSEESGGLGDYLQSLKSPNCQSPLMKNASSGDPQNPRSPE